MHIKDKFQIKGIPLIKFQKKDIIEKIVAGSFYMNSLKTFRERYYKDFDEEIGDPHEGMLYINNGYMIVDKPKQEIKDLNNYLLSTVRSNDFVFCMFGINPSKYSEFIFSDEQKKKWLEIYDTALIITDQKEYFKRIQTAASNKNITIGGNFVMYYDEQSGDINPWLTALTEGTQKVAYFKRKRYEYQQEYRFIAENSEGIDYLELTIGNISDISIVYPLKDFFNSKFIKHH